MKRTSLEERKAHCKRFGHSWIKPMYSSLRRCSWCEEYEKAEQVKRENS